MKKILLGKGSEYGNITLFNHSLSVLNFGLYILNHTIDIKSIENKDFLYNVIVALAFHDIGKCNENIQNILKGKKTSSTYSHNILSWAYLMATDFKNSSILPSILYHHPVEFLNKKDEEPCDLNTIYKELKKEKNKKNYELFFNEINNYLINTYPDIYRTFSLTYNEDKGCKELAKVYLNGDIRNLEDNEILLHKAEITIIRSILITADRMVSEDYLNNERYLNNDIKYMEDKFNSETVLDDKVKDVNLFELRDKDGNFIYSDKERLKTQNEDLEKIMASKKSGIILSASAGYGKTLMGIKWLIKNRTKSYWVVPRNVIANSTYDSIKEELQKMNSPMTVGLLLAGEFKHGNESSDIIVTNIDNFLSYGIKNSMSINMAKIMSTNVIFDEFHEFFGHEPLFSAFIDFINMRLLFTKDKTKTLMMSATPLAYDGLLYTDEIEKIEAHPFNGDMKVNVRYLKLNNITDLEGKIESDSFIICDTVNKSQDIYKANEYNGLLVHSKFTSERRVEIEEEIKRTHNKHSKVSERGIVYGTNIIGVGLDISAKHIYDVVISPEDTIQRGCGRAGRFNEKEYNSEIDYYVCDIDSPMRSKMFSSKLSRAWLDMLKEYDNTTITKNKLYELYNKFYIDNKKEVKKLYLKKYNESYKTLRELKPYRCNSVKTDDEKRLSTRNNFRGSSSSVYAIAPYVNNKEMLSNPIVVNKDDIKDNESEKRYNDERLNDLIKKGIINSYQRKDIRSNHRYDKTVFFRYALSQDNPYRLFEATYDDRLGLSMNNSDECGDID